MEPPSVSADWDHENDFFRIQFIRTKHSMQMLG